MIKVNVIAVGKVKEKYFREAVEEYSKRLSRFCELNVIEVKEENFTTKPSALDAKKIIEREGEDIAKKVKGRVVAMCIEGEKISSVKLGKMLSECVSKGEEISFVIGGSYGISESVKKLADDKISFSDMTFPHTLFRVMLLEQVYRGFMIEAGADYHK
jgi:23S rRNA (pseudouridine1915-N3)-methyltransferase